MTTTRTARSSELASAARTLADHCGRDLAVVLPGDPRYDESRLGWNRTIDSRPPVIVRARTGQDLQDVVRVCRVYDVPMAVQATGHGTLVPPDDALLVKTTDMDEVIIDPYRRLATVGPGTTWHQVNAAAARHGLGSLAGRCGTVGVTGYTLGGGAGWLSRTHGFAADSVVSAELVLADGSAVRADHDRNAELFWGIRGGGGNFGLVTSLTFQLFPAQHVFGGMSFYPSECAGDILGAYRDWSADEPEGMNTAVLLMRLPPAPVIPEPLRGRQVVALRVFTTTAERVARDQVAPLLAAAGTPLHDGLAVRDFEQASRATNGPDVPPVAHRQLLQLFDTLPDALLEHLVTEGLHPQAPFAFVELRNWGGAMARPGTLAGPAGHRQTPYSVMAVAPYPSPDRSGVDATLDRFDATLAGFATGGSFLNLLTEPARTHTAFTPANLQRLRDLKRAVDPDTFFRPSHTIDPAPRPDHASC